MSVTLLANTPNPIDIMYIAGRVCRKKILIRFQKKLKISL